MKEFTEKYALPISIILSVVLLYASFSLLQKQNSDSQQPSAVSIGPGGTGEYQETQGPTTGIEIDLSAKELRGAPNATLTLIELSDFECPFCERSYPVIKQILQEYEGRVNLAYFHLPLHQHSQIMAEAFECAGLQGKRWEMHDLIFEKSEEFFDETKDDYISDDSALSKLKLMASELGLNQTQFDSCVDFSKTRPIVEQDQAVAMRFLIRGTPTFIVNGNKYSGSMPFEQMKQVIEENLKAVKT